MVVVLELKDDFARVASDDFNAADRRIFADFTERKVAKEDVTQN